jgi:hypothetical protein
MPAVGTTGPCREQGQPHNLLVAELQHGVDAPPVEALDEPVDRLEAHLPVVLAGELCELPSQQRQQGQRLGDVI